jgi:crossover junction endodeoxyribonuclease RuvC
MTLFDTQTPAAGGAPVPSVAGTDETDRVAGQGEGSAARSALIVVGVDVSLAATGVGCQHSACVIASKGTRDDTLAQRQQRLRHLRRQIIARAGVGCPDCDSEPQLVVIEGPSYASAASASAHDRSGLWWLLIDAFTVRGWRVVEVPPSSLKKYATGKGNASKDQVLASAVRRFDFSIDNNNAADAAWLAALGHDLLGQPLIELPKDHMAALPALRARLTTGEDQA